MKNTEDTSSDESSTCYKTEDLSTYSKVLCLYTREPDSYQLYAIEDKQSACFSQGWEKFLELLKHTVSREIGTSGISERAIEAEAAVEFTGLQGVPIKVTELRRNDEGQTRGIITIIENENDFSHWMISHILEQARMDLDEKPAVGHGKLYAEMFTDYFAQNLKNTTKNDQWEEGGREYFLEKTRYFTDRFLKIECILPAFPCKSSNIEKVHGVFPDKGEELALRRLAAATQEVRKFYPPGMKIWIVSDGHVFSDCIGVDDDVVDEYTDRLHGFYQDLAVPGNDAIGFAGLKELFFTGETVLDFDEEMVSDIELPHYTGSKICENSELSRRILMKGFDTDDGSLRKQILIPGHPRLHLFRGFSRFMIDDLSHLAHFKNVSRKCFKKVVSKVAFEMIKRNDAYSNLVELLFPHHMRFSIHAHTNSGPKFGVKIISGNQCRTVKSLESLDEPSFEDLLHIPTPWHNCVIKLGDAYYLTKSKVVFEAITSGLYEGQWKEGGEQKNLGGHFVLKKKMHVQKQM